MPVAFNKQTGELRVLDGSGQWVAPKTAENPQTGERLYLDGQEWKPVPLSDDEEGAGFAASVLQGPTMGFGDELVATLENPIETVRSTITGEASPGYDASLKKFRGIENRYREANPITSTVATGVAGLAGGGVQLGRSAFNAAGRVLPNAGRIGQAMGAGAAFGGVSGFGMGEGGVANRLESSVLGAAVGAGFGAAAEVAVPAVGALIQRVRGNPRLYDPRAGRLTPAGEQAALEAGLDPAQASAALQREFAQEAQGALNPGQAAAVAQARTLPVPVPLRRGQATLDPDQQMFESQAGKGVYGQLAGETIRGSDEAQQAALRGNVREIANRIGGGQVSELGDGVARVQGQLARSADASRGAIRGLYDLARERGAGATVSGQQVSQAVFDVTQELNQAGLTRRAAGRVHEIIDELQGLATASQQRPATTIAEIFARRQELSALARGAPTPETTAAGTAKRSLDRWLSNALDNDLITGDPNAVQTWRAAILARRLHAQRFEAGDFVAKLVARRKDGSNELALDPQAAVNLIFGRSETGFTSQNGMVRGLMRLRSELGENSNDWRALREEAFLRMARAGEGQGTPTGVDFSGAKFAKAWENALAKSPGTMRLLFTEQERNLISQFATVARRVTTPVKGGANFSNTSAGTAQVLRKLMMSSFMGPKMMAFFQGTPIVQGLQNISAEMRAQSAVLNRIQQGIRPQPTPRLNRAVELGTGSTANALVQSVLGDP